MTLLSFSGYSQKENKKPRDFHTDQQLAIERRNHDCVHKGKKTFSERLKNYPFNMAAQIKLVSFLQKSDKITGENTSKFMTIPKLNDTICLSKLYEIKNLSITEVDTLTDILYNVGFRGPTFLTQELSCYEPRNAILFIDKNGKVFEYIEICFECQKITQSSNKIILGDFCDQKFYMLKKIFRRAGVSHGTSDEDR